MNTTKPRIKIRVFEATRNYGLMVLRVDGKSYRRTVVTDVDIKQHGGLDGALAYYQAGSYHALADIVIEAQH